ncbi:DUF3889 domain-containing protein [Paenibacillus sp. NEAU-GSW1]|uniref:DUF3889 domain-containing protein n=1 Tax=Paenibacillus sp. NEAU-GSW1 TaxID=2682486 RepID=UPI0020A663BC|nr:DUF3889 domain-containing protein [Paenibacillus sp. NEAU-GSW1]
MTIWLLIWIGLSFNLSNYSVAEASKSTLEPEYAKWGRLAVQETKNKYNADILDYKYEGRFPISSQTVEERFRLWIVQGTKEFGVRVRIHVRLDDDSAEAIEFEELQ